MSPNLPFLFVLGSCLAFKSIALECKKGYYSKFAAHIDISECAEEMHYCITAACDIGPNERIMFWECSPQNNCDKFDSGYDKNAKTSSCRCKFGLKDTNLGNENLTFPLHGSLDDAVLEPFFVEYKVEQEQPSSGAAQKYVSPKYLAIFCAMLVFAILLG